MRVRAGEAAESFRTIQGGHLFINEMKRQDTNTPGKEKHFSWSLFLSGVAALVLLHVVALTRGEYWTYSHPDWDKHFYEVYGQYSIVPCTDVWDMQQRTNCRVRNWGFGIDDGKPFVSWSVWAMDKDGNWHPVEKRKGQGNAL
jgi:hypothetical protein